MESLTNKTTYTNWPQPIILGKYRLMGELGTWWASTEDCIPLKHHKTSEEALLDLGMTLLELTYYNVSEIK